MCVGGGDQCRLNVVMSVSHPRCTSDIHRIGPTLRHTAYILQIFTCNIYLYHKYIYI